MIAPTDLVDRRFAVGTFCNARVHVVHNDLGVSADLAGGLVVRVAAFPARLEAARADGFALAAAAWPSDRVLAARACAPLERL